MILLPGVAGCSDSGGDKPGAAPSAGPGSGEGHHGPMFPVCGGVGDQAVSDLTKMSGLINTARNSVGCQWLAGGGILGPHFFLFLVSRQSDRARSKTEELSRASVEDINIDGHGGFIAVGNEPNLAIRCAKSGSSFRTTSSMVGQLQPKAVPAAMRHRKELARQSIANSK